MTGLRRAARKRPTGARMEARLALVLLLPSVVVVFGIVVYPMLRTLLISFFNVDTPFGGRFPFVGLDNYTSILTSPDFWATTRRTLYFTLVSTGLELVLGIGLALLLIAPLRGRWLLRALVVLPWALPTIVNGSLWRSIFDAQYGALNAVLTQLHVTETYHAWLGTPFMALNLVILADVWKNTSLVAFFLLAGLQTIPRDIYEQARVDGAGAVRSFFSITLPLLVPSISIVLVLRTIEAFKVFDIIYIMTRGGPASGTQTIAFYTYLQAFSDQRFGYGSALAYLIVVIILMLSALYLRLLRSNEMSAL